MNSLGFLVVLIAIPLITVSQFTSNHLESRRTSLTSRGSSTHEKSGCRPTAYEKYNNVKFTHITNEYGQKVKLGTPVDVGCCIG